MNNSVIALLIGAIFGTGNGTKTPDSTEIVSAINTLTPDEKDKLIKKLAAAKDKITGQNEITTVQGSITVGATPVKILDSNNKRKNLIIAVNAGAAYVTFDAPAPLGQGHIVTTNSPLNLYKNIPSGNVYATRTSSGTVFYAQGISQNVSDGNGVTRNFILNAGDSVQIANSKTRTALILNQIRPGAELVYLSIGQNQGEQGLLFPTTNLVWNENAPSDSIYATADLTNGAAVVVSVTETV